MMTPEENAARFNQAGESGLPGLVGMTVHAIGESGVDAVPPVTPALMAPNGFLHAASVIALADSCCGYGTMASLPEGATGFTASN